MQSAVKIAGMAILGSFLVLLLKPVTASPGAPCSLGCVTTYGYDNSRDNVNRNESLLKATGLSSFGNATSSPDLNGAIYAQPLYISQIIVKGQSSPMNVVFVATEENWVYALDGDSFNNQPFWAVNLNNTANKETAVPDRVLPFGCTDISPEVGITGTPVINAAANVLYVVSKHYNTGNGSVTQRLNALNLFDGSAAAPALDVGQVLGTSFSALNQNQRAGLALAGQGVLKGGPLIYVVWGSHCDTGTYSGTVAAFQLVSGALQLSAAFRDEGSSGSEGGIWMSGAAPAVNQRGKGGQNVADVYLASGNGSFSPTNGQYGESVIRLHDTSNSISVSGSYTPNAWSVLNDGSGAKCISPLHLPPPYPSGTTVCSANNFELGSGGVILARPTGSGNLPPGDNFVILAGGKEGVFYVIDPSNMNNSGADTQDPCGAYAIQCLGAIQLPLPCCNGIRDYGNRGSAAFWAGNATHQENVLYVAGSLDSEIRAYKMNGGGGTFATATLFGHAPAPNPNGNNQIPYPGSSPVISWNTNGGAASNAILWILDTSGYGGGPAKLFAYQAVPPSPGNQFPQEWSDTTNGPAPTKFMVPTVINGHVYVGGKKPNATCNPGSCLGQAVSWH
jgi:hypothetical protein